MFHSNILTFIVFEISAYIRTERNYFFYFVYKLECYSDASIRIYYYKIKLYNYKNSYLITIHNYIL